MTIKNRYKIDKETILSKAHYELKQYDISYLRNNGKWQKQRREVFERGSAVCALMFDNSTKNIILIKQFRLPTVLNGYDDLLIEVPAGLLEGEAPQKRMIEEIKEETGYEVSELNFVFEAFMSAGAVTEKIHFFTAKYNEKSKIYEGGGLEEEGEDIDVIEMPFDEAFAMIASGQIVDAKTIMLLQYAKINIFKD